MAHTSRRWREDLRTRRSPCREGGGTAPSSVRGGGRPRSSAQAKRKLKRNSTSEYVTCPPALDGQQTEKDEGLGSTAASRRETPRQPDRDEASSTASGEERALASRSAQGVESSAREPNARRQRTAPAERAGRSRREPIGREARPRQSLRRGRAATATASPEQLGTASRAEDAGVPRRRAQVPARTAPAEDKTRLAHADQNEQEQEAAAPGERQGERYALGRRAGEGSRRQERAKPRTPLPRSSEPGCPSPFTPSVRTRRAAMKRVPTSRIRAIDVASLNSLPKKTVTSLSGRDPERPDDERSESRRR